MMDLGMTYYWLTAEALAAGETRLALPVIPCRFGCKDPAAVIVYLPEGCICWRDPVQALCQQHLVNMESTGPAFLIVDLRPTAVDNSSEPIDDNWEPIGEPVGRVVSKLDRTRKKVA